MTPRLPTPGADQGQWGALLNEFLGQSLDDNGNLKSGTVGATQLQAGAIAVSHLSTTIQSQLASIPSGGGTAAWGSITGTIGNQTDLNTALGTKLPTPLTLTGSAPIPAGTTPRFIIRT